MEGRKEERRVDFFFDFETAGLMDGGGMGCRESAAYLERRESVTEGWRGTEDAEESSQRQIHCNYFT